MATISYSVSGEGRGHAARARVVLENLRQRHELVVYCYGDAWDILAPFCRTSQIELRRIPGLRFAYDKRGKLDRPTSALSAVPFLLDAPRWFFHLARQLEADQTDLVLVDFEPLLPRAAALAQIPYISLDHQQFLIACNLSSLSPRLGAQARLLATLSLPFYNNPVSSLISSFFFPPLKPQTRAVKQVGVLLRKEIEEARPEEGNHLVAYVRRKPPPEVLRALEEFGHPVRVYGTERTDRLGSLDFQRIDPRAFAADLASCRALVTTAGNQVVGEALSLGKPVLAFPEPGNAEQEINGHFLSQSGAGVSVDAGRFSASDLRAFLNQRDRYRANIDQARMNGNPLTLATIEAAAARRPLPEVERQQVRRPAPVGWSATP